MLSLFSDSAVDACAVASLKASFDAATRLIASASSFFAEATRVCDALQESKAIRVPSSERDVLGSHSASSNFDTSAKLLLILCKDSEFLSCIRDRTLDVAALIDL